MTPDPIHPERWRADLMLLIATTGWAATFALTKNALDDASPGLFLALRFFVGTVAALVIARKQLHHLPSLRRGAALGVFLWAGYVLGTFGLRYTTATRSAFLTSLAVILVPILGAAIFRRRIPGVSWVAAFLATAGLAVMSRDALSGGGTLLGDLLTLGCALGYALHILFIDRWSSRILPGPAVASQLFVATLLSLATLPFETLRLDPTPSLVATILFTGIFASAVFIYMQIWAQARTTAVRTALFFSLEPLFATGFAFLILGEGFPTETLVGGGLIVLAILVAELWPRLARSFGASPSGVA